MADVCGTITISFTGTISKRRLLEEFSEELFKDGAVELMSVDNEKLKLEIHEFEFDEVEEFDEYGEVVDYEEEERVV